MGSDPGRGTRETPCHRQQASRVEAEGDVTAKADTLSVLTYNIHGLPGILAKDRPRDRMPTIGWLAHKYDVVLFQEDFEYHDELARRLRADANGYVGNGSWSRPSLLPINFGRQCAVLTERNETKRLTMKRRK